MLGWREPGRGVEAAMQALHVLWRIWNWDDQRNNLRDWQQTHGRLRNTQVVS